MKKIVFHIGAHKTGSTYIQKALADNYELLKENSILYPKQWRNFLWGHHEFVLEVMKNFTSDNYIKLLKEIFLKWLEKYETIILSSENMEYFKLEHLVRLAALQDIAKVEVVFFIRSISELSFSVWQEDIKHGKYSTFEEFLLLQYLAPFKSEIFNYSIVIEKYLKAMKKIDFKIVVYDNLKYENQDIAEYFFKNIVNFYNEKVHIIKEKINTSLDKFDIEILRSLNYIASLYNLPQNDNLRNKFIENKSKFSDILEELKLKSQKSIKIVNVNDSSYVPLSIYNTCYKDYETLFLNASDNGNIFYELKNKEHEIIDPNFWLSDINTESLHHIFDTLEMI